MHELFESAGAPRDQGLDQGLAYRGAVRDGVARAGVRSRSRRRFGLAPFAGGPVLGRGPGRELIRHYTHLAERAEGLALGAGLRLESVVELMFREPGALGLSAAALAVAGGPTASPAVGRALPVPSRGADRWLLRRSRPEVGFVSVEATLPWLVGAVGGLNEWGLAAALAPGDAPAVPSLLVQEVLQRFRDLPSALDWCAKRPGAGDGALLLADAAGGLATVHFEGEGRSVGRSDRGVLVAGVGSPEAAELCKQLEDALDRADGDAAPPVGACLSGAAPAAGRLVLAPAAGRVVLTDAAGAATEVEVRPEGAGRDPA
ncbi:MAG: hypothetical protein ACQGVK_00995 [Myxococcota bacterium]